jgi:hypothetical protein
MGGSTRLLGCRRDIWILLTRESRIIVSRKLRQKQ